MAVAGKMIAIKQHLSKLVSDTLAKICNPQLVGKWLQHTASYHKVQKTLLVIVLVTSRFPWLPIANLSANARHLISELH